MTEPTVSLHQVTKAYRHFRLDRIDLDLGAGRITGLIGPNGAGKSTLFRIIMGLVRPDAGRVRVLGRSMPGEQAAIKGLVGYVSEDMRLHPSRSLRWHAELVRSFHPTWDATRAGELAGRFELPLGQRAGELSRGQTVKAMLFLALSHRPRLLLLDEPTAGLDPLARIDLLEELARIVRSEGLSVLFSSHLTGDLELLADDVVLLHAGRLIEAGPRERLLGRAAVAAGDPAGAHAPGLALDSWFRRRVTEEVSHAV
jgi:ABC-2 type transport system ATP-binding protein